MPYKRKARVLFFGSHDVCRALLAAHLANTIGATWIEARAVALSVDLSPVDCAQAGIDTKNQTLDCLDADCIAWADLLVTLDETADQTCPSLPARVQKRFYPIPQPQTAQAWALARDAIRQRVEGMIGGMRMLG